MPLLAISSSWVPDSAMVPPETTMIRSARRIVDSRWAMTKEVRPRSSVSSAFWMSIFGVGVDGGGGFIEDHDARIGQQRSGEGDELLLPHRQPAAPLAHLGLVSVLHAGDEFVSVHGLRRRHDLLVGGVQPP
jgi:hypothetical protein